MENKNLVKEKLTVQQAVDKTNSAMKDTVTRMDNLKADLEMQIETLRNDFVVIEYTMDDGTIISLKGLK